MINRVNSYYVGYKNRFEESEDYTEPFNFIAYRWESKRLNGR